MKIKNSKFPLARPLEERENIFKGMASEKATTELFRGIAGRDIIPLTISEEIFMGEFQSRIPQKVPAQNLLK